MRWNLEWGPHLKAFEARAKRGAAVPAPLKNRPRLHRHDHRYLSAFNTLSRSRQYGMSAPQPITLAEMLALFQLHEINEPADRQRYVKVLQDMDEVYLTFMAEKAERDRQKKSGG